MSLEELMNVDVSVASHKVSTSRESPGIITVITGEEIEHSGARNLLDVLNQVPGFWFGTDTQSVVGVGFRGMWGHEGKILLLIDGMEMNEILYSTLQFWNHYPINIIQKVEIIRGPGSAIYGGNAELAVIKITSKSVADLGGAKVVATVGATSTEISRKDLALGLGKKVGDWNFAFSGRVGESSLSDRTYTDSNGQTVNMASSSTQDPIFLNLGVNHGDFESHFIFDRFHTTDQTAFGVNLPGPYGEDFTTIAGNAKYNFHVSDSVVVTPSIGIKRDQPWQVTDPGVVVIPGVAYDKTGTRASAGLSAAMTLNEHFSLLAGTDVHNDEATDHIGVFSTGQKTVDYFNYAFFTELTGNLPWFDVTAGARYDHNSYFDGSFSPRIALVKKIDSAHIKFLYDEAFRAPSVEDINFSVSKILPEKTRSYEIELGNTFNEHFYASINAFKTTIDSPIIYDYSGGDAYFNDTTVSTQGAEVELRYKNSWGYLRSGYSFYNVAGHTIDSYAIPGHPSENVALPTSKVTLQGNVNLWNNQYWLNPSLIWISERYGYNYDATQGAMTLQRNAPSLLANLFLERKDLFQKNLSMGVGVYDLFDQNPGFIQAYNGGHPPIPSLSREWVLRMSYGVPF